MSHPIALGFLGLLCFSIPLSPSPRALELWSDRPEGQRLTLAGSLKWTTILSHAPADSVLFPQRWSAAALSRARLTLTAQPARWVRAELTYEQRARSLSENAGAGGGAGILPADIAAPYRIAQIDEALVEIGNTFAYRHELDRAVLSLRVGNGQLTVGRQAVGWGRGVLFSAVDIFAPFTPLESDREWRRGIDAVRGGLPLSDRLAVEVVTAFGDSLEASAFIGRLHGRIGDVDGELIAGWRREDELYALTASAPLFDAEVHGEFALFRSPSAVTGGGAFDRDDLAVKAVLGSSYSLDLPGGLIMIGEYHYSGFGLPEIAELSALGTEPEFVTRLAHGDTQIIGRHAGALQISCGIASMTPTSLAWIFSPVDGSGVLVPAITWIFSDNLTFNANGYLPHGASPREGDPRSEYGGTPASGLVQISFYF